VREREGPAPQWLQGAWEGEGGARGDTLTRLASLVTLSRNAGEGLSARHIRFTVP
jgi:hypothetical protein